MLLDFTSNLSVSQIYELLLLHIWKTDLGELSTKSNYREKAPYLFSKLFERFEVISAVWKKICAINWFHTCLFQLTQKDPLFCVLLNYSTFDQTISLFLYAIRNEKMQQQMYFLCFWRTTTYLLKMEAAEDPLMGLSRFPSFICFSYVY